MEDAPRFSISGVKIVGRWDWNIGMKCMVCLLDVKKGSEVVRCPHCGNISHEAHMREWLHVKDYCPACKQRLSESELVKVALE